MRAYVSIDIGGTFTDVVVLREDGLINFFKVSSTPREPEKAVSEVLRLLRDNEIIEVVHATTVATNAVFGQIGLEIPKTALVTTKGFRDVIEIGRQNRPRLYDLFFDKPKQFVPRELRFEINERVDAWGRVVREPDDNELTRLAKSLVDENVVSVAISLLHSYINPSNEEKIEGYLKKYIKYISSSHKVAPEPREYERTSTTVVNAVLMPLVARYIDALKKLFEEYRVQRFFIMSSSGGLIDDSEAVERPVQLIESGPAAGVIASAEFSKALNIAKIISFDMGGTTAKAGTVVDYEISITTEYEVGGEAHYGRITKGSGYPIRFPFIDLSEVSAGGGTIIWRDEVGALRIGPLSAGADPGPACYGRGGADPTITDANLYLGRIPEKLAGGLLTLSRELAEKALRRLGDPEEVSAEAVELANLEMARAIRLVTIERGLDPSEFTLVAFGGAGPQHASEIAEELGIRRIIIPPQPGNFSALGLLLADQRFEVRSSFPRDLEREYQLLEKRIINRIGSVDYFLRYADVRYLGQGWELTIPVSKPADIDRIRRDFNERHYRAYGFILEEDVEIVTIRVFGVKKRHIDISSLTKIIKRSSERVSPRGSRRAYLLGEWVRAYVYYRDDLGINQIIEGPAIIEEMSSTTIIPQGWIGRVGSYGEIHMERR
ncbi:MAG: hydantoinase/oxoprolinase family protein [Sulfolobales archaeon]